MENRIKCRGLEKPLSFNLYLRVPFINRLLDMNPTLRQNQAVLKIQRHISKSFTYPHRHIFLLLKRAINECVGIRPNDKHIFKYHKQTTLFKKQLQKPGCLYKNKTSFLLSCNMRAVEAVFLLVLNYWDVIY